LQPFYHAKSQSLDQIHHIEVEEQQEFDVNISSSLSP
jgi:hypothetical protein